MIIIIFFNCLLNPKVLIAPDCNCVPEVVVVIVVVVAAAAAVVVVMVVEVPAVVIVVVVAAVVVAVVVIFEDSSSDQSLRILSMSAGFNFFLFGIDIFFITEQLDSDVGLAEAVGQEIKI